MAIELPRRGGGGSAPRPVRAPTAENVTQANIARDPGVRVPSGGGVGQALAQAGASLQGTSSRFAQTQINKIRRNEGLARDADDNTYAEELATNLRDLESSSDLSEDEVIEKASEAAEKRKEEILANHKGSEESRAMLANRLDSRAISFTDTLAAKNVAAADSRLNQTVGRRISAITASVTQDPEVLLAEDPAEVFRKHAGVLEDEIDFLNLSPPQQRIVRRAGQQEIAETMISPLIRDGNFERARDLLRSDDLEEIIEPAARRDMVRRVNEAEKGLGKARAEAQGMLDTAGILLGPNASEEEIRSAAAELAGISQSQGVETIAVGNNVLVLDKNTGALLQRIEGESSEQEAERAGAVERAKLTARREVVNQILQAAGVDPLETQQQEPGPDGQPGDGGESAAIVTPFGEEESASADMQDASRLFLASRRLLMAGETASANSLLGQARFIIENSTDIQRERELDKPIGAELASELGVGIGTTFRDVLGRLPRSPEEQAQARSSASERGRQQVGGEEQISFIDEARTVVSDLLEEIQEDPGIVGARGSLRATGQTATQVLGDLGLRSLKEAAQDIAFDATDLGLDDAAALFESPTLSVLDITENTLGLILARLRTPTGRIPVDVIKRSIADVQLTGVKGSGQVQNRLNFILDQLNRRADSVSRRFGLEQEEPAQDDTAGQPRFRVENGKLVPVEEGSE